MVYCRAHGMMEQELLLPRSGRAGTLEHIFDQRRGKRREKMELWFLVEFFNRYPHIFNKPLIPRLPGYIPRAEPEWAFMGLFIGYKTEILRCCNKCSQVWCGLHFESITFNLKFS